MGQFYQSALAEALGWSLIDSFWKTGTLWIFYVLITGNGRKFRASTRYLIAVSVLTLATGWFFYSVVSGYQDLLQGRSIHSISFYFREHFQHTLPAVGFLNSVVPVISLIYAITLFFLALQYCTIYFQGRNKLRTDLKPANEEILTSLAELSERIGIHKPIQVWISERTNSALTFNFLKPVVLLPFSIVNNLTMAQVKAVIAHELIHIRRNDYLINLIMSFSGLVLFFNPFARILQNVIRKERENSCDDEVLSLGFGSLEYAESLYLIGRSGLAPSGFVLALSGNNQYSLLERVKRILNRRQTGPSILKPFFFLTLCFFITFFVLRDHREERKVVDKGLVPYHLNPDSLAASHPGSLAVTETPVIHPASPLSKKTHPANSTKVKKEIVKPATVPDRIEIVADRASIFERDGAKTIFISGKPHVIEFTIIETKPIVPTVNNPGKILPYVPPSTFYAPDQSDSVAPKPAKPVDI